MEKKETRIIPKRKKIIKKKKRIKGNCIIGCIA
jgi:hypothetical protein